MRELEAAGRGWEPDENNQQMDDTAVAGGHATYRTSPRPHRPKSRHSLRVMSAVGSPRVCCADMCRRKAGRRGPFEGRPRWANGGQGGLTAIIEEVPKGHSLLLLLLGRCKREIHTLALLAGEGAAAWVRRRWRAEGETGGAAAAAAAAARARARLAAWRARTESDGKGTTYA